LHVLANPAGTRRTRGEFPPEPSPVSVVAFFVGLRGSRPNEPMEDFAMDWNRVEGNWKQMKGKVKEQWGKLTDDDLTAINGQRQQLEGRIQERYGIQKDEVKRQIDDWYSRQSW
jgi:uncharacterized protein YjbJ (UPF0337 family)